MKLKRMGQRKRDKIREKGGERKEEKRKKK